MTIIISLEVATCIIGFVFMFCNSRPALWVASFSVSIVCGLLAAFLN